MGGAERMGYEARGARREVRVRGALLPILLEQEQIISGGALEREQRAALAARCAASLSLSRWWWGQSHSAGSQVRSHSHLLLGRPTYNVPPGARPGPPGRPAPAPSEPRAPPAACCPPAPFSRHCHRAGFRSTSSAPVPLGHYFRPSERHPLRRFPPSLGRQRDATAHSRPIYRPPAPGARGMGLPRTPMAQPAS